MPVDLRDRGLMNDNLPHDITDTSTGPARRSLGSGSEDADSRGSQFRSAEAGSRLRESVPMIGMVGALELLAMVVRDWGEDLVCQQKQFEDHGHFVRRYAHGGAPDCLIGLALASANVRVHDLEAMGDVGIRELYFRDKLPITLTLGAMAVLDAAQCAQDRGRPWGDALQDAVAAGSQFLDLIPDSVLDPW
jgi:hypothetical protein